MIKFTCWDDGCSNLNGQKSQIKVEKYHEAQVRHLLCSPPAPHNPSAPPPLTSWIYCIATLHDATFPLTVRLGSKVSILQWVGWIQSDVKNNKCKKVTSLGTWLFSTLLHCQSPWSMKVSRRAATKALASGCSWFGPGHVGTVGGQPFHHGRWARLLSKGENEGLLTTGRSVREKDLKGVVLVRPWVLEEKAGRSAAEEESLSCLVRPPSFTAIVRVLLLLLLVKGLLEIPATDERGG